MQDDYLYLYDNNELIARITSRYWQTEINQFNGQVKPAFDTTYLLTKTDANFKINFKPQITFALYNFFDLRSPEMLYRYYAPNKSLLYLYIQTAVQLIDKKWLIFLNKDGMGFYCIANKISLEECNMIPLANFFDCPNILKTKYQTLHQLHFVARFNQEFVPFMLRGILTSLLMIESILIIFSWQIYQHVSLKKKIVTSLVNNQPIIF